MPIYEHPFIAVVGRRGSGRTTLVNRLAELYDFEVCDIDAEAARLHHKYLQKEPETSLGNAGKLPA